MARILIVEDSPSQLLSIQRIVEKLGHETITATDGNTGVEAAKAHLPDLVLMDVVMPKINGFQATRTLKREPATQHVPVVLVTTKDQDTDRLWGIRQGRAPTSPSLSQRVNWLEVMERIFSQPKAKANE